TIKRYSNLKSEAFPPRRATMVESNKEGSGMKDRRVLVGYRRIRLNGERIPVKVLPTKFPCMIVPSQRFCVDEFQCSRVRVCNPSRPQRRLIFEWGDARGNFRINWKNSERVR
ncbi:MAG: hypothetical protein ACE5I8_12855, partial [Thermodesulfobacteriota bacterium]